MFEKSTDARLGAIMLLVVLFSSGCQKKAAQA
jgi:hypothetical protein